MDEVLNNGLMYRAVATGNITTPRDLPVEGDYTGYLAEIKAMPNSDFVKDGKGEQLLRQAISDAQHKSGAFFASKDRDNSDYSSPEYDEIKQYYAVVRALAERLPTDILKKSEFRNLSSVVQGVIQARAAIEGAQQGLPPSPPKDKGKGAEVG